MRAILEWFREQMEWREYQDWLGRCQPRIDHAGRPHRWNEVVFTPAAKISELPPGHYEPGTYTYRGARHTVFIAMDVR